MAWPSFTLYHMTLLLPFFACACASALGERAPGAFAAALYLFKPQVIGKLSTSYSSPLPCAHAFPKFPMDPNLP